MAASSTTSSIPALVQRLRSGRPADVRQAATKLLNVANQGPGHRQAIVEAGGVPALAQLVGSTDVQLACDAMAALVNCAKDQTLEVVGSAFAAAGGMPPLARRLARSDASDNERMVAGYLAFLVLQGQRGSADASRRALLDAGCLPVLVRMLGRPEVQLSAVSVLLEFCTSSQPAFPEAAFAAGAVPALTALLRSSDANVQAAVCSALTNIVRYSSGPAAAGVTACVGAGTAPLLVQLVGSSGQEVRNRAVIALHNLTLDHEEGLAAAAAAGAIPALVRYLNRGGVDRSAHFASGMLARLCLHSAACAREAAAAGAAQPLKRWQRLQAPGTVGAAKLQAALTALSDAGEALPAASAAPPTSPAPQPPAPKPPRVCAAPGCSAVHGLCLCAGCRSVRYCGEACSRAHWRAHKAECRRLQATRTAQQQ